MAKLKGNRVRVVIEFDAPHFQSFNETRDYIKTAIERWERGGPSEFWHEWKLKFVSTELVSHDAVLHKKV